VPAPKNEQSSVIAMDMQFFFFNAFGMKIKKDNVTLYFARLNESGTIPSLSQWKRASWRDGKTFYLLNATPGQWVAAGLIYIDPGLLYDTKKAVLFPDEMVKASKVDVIARKGTYMGSFQVTQDKDKNILDPTQTFYLQSFLGKESSLKTEDKITDFIRLDFKQGGVVELCSYTVEQNEALRKDSRQKAAKDLGAPWAGRFQ